MKQYALPLKEYYLKPNIENMYTKSLYYNKTIENASDTNLFRTYLKLYAQHNLD